MQRLAGVAQSGLAFTYDGSLRGSRPAWGFID